MISSKIFASDGSNTRFLSDFIVRSEQFCRVYNYVYDTNGVDGDTDVASGLTIRIVDVPQSDDLVTIDKWDLVDNSISFYTSPYSGSRVYIEVATTAEEFGNTLVQPAVERAEEAAAAAVASAVVAAASEAASALSEAAAALSETNSAASAAAALASQNAAALSESNASDSETAAGLSEAAASLSEAAAALSETNAAASEIAALASQNAASASSVAALASENKSQEWAENPEDVAVEVGQYSALHWAAKASVFNPALYATLSGATFTGTVQTPLIKADTIENIAGTESHSVSTMGIETIVNANGTAIKYPDGTMICQGKKTVAITTSTTKGALFGGSTETFTFPLSFVGDLPNVSSASENRGFNAWSACGLPTFGSVSLAPMSYHSAGSIVQGYIAIGRWK